ncbi:3',5'-cyclic-AMP phosphodiesterase [Parashewanella tropica]|uniref:3',5'-cyclic-AMP phosphodiesterase n=1 Tax=Parashewanella tropica TaxID=2547970 RepID=UPI001478F734|nr:3',5'-cyclic-AMP phosphodiesterase [Parashewanella tropica]
MTDTSITYVGKQTDNIQVVQITDTHLFASDDGQLLGVNTAQSFEAVVDLVIDNQHDADLVMMTGDISQDNTIESYHRFAKQSQRLALPCHFVPGNHDENQMMHQELKGEHLRPEKHLIFDNWHIVMLNSTIVGKPAGRLEESQFKVIEQAVRAHPDKHLLLVMHHHPIPVGCRWLDQHWMQNGGDFLERVSQYPQVKGIVWGHVHQEVNEVYKGPHGDIPLLATPSTCIQFTPKSNHFALDGLQPGYRLLQLQGDGSICSTIYRLKGDKFSPEHEASGY